MDLWLRFITPPSSRCCSLLTLQRRIMNQMNPPQLGFLRHTGWETVRCVQVGFGLLHADFRFMVWTREFWLPPEQLIGRSGGLFHDTWPQLASLRTATHTHTHKEIFQHCHKVCFQWHVSSQLCLQWQQQVCKGETSALSAPWPQQSSAENKDQMKKDVLIYTF